MRVITRCRAHHLLTLGTTSLLILLASVSFAEVTYHEAKPRDPRATTGHVTDDAHIRIYGTISNKDLKEIENVIDKVISNTNFISDGGNVNPLVVLESPGGDLRAAMKIGELLRTKSAMTWVLPGTRCSSACVFLLAAGVHRVVSPGALIGLHRPIYEEQWYSDLSKKKAEEAYADLVDKCKQYFLRMGIPLRVLELMLEVPSGSVSYLDSISASRLGLDGSDPAYDEWDKAREHRR
jgi:ATP-dependent protease ClpP protease subunit